MKFWSPFVLIILQQVLASDSSASKVATLQSSSATVCTSPVSSCLQKCLKNLNIFQNGNATSLVPAEVADCSCETYDGKYNSVGAYGKFGDNDGVWGIKKSSGVLSLSFKNGNICKTAYGVQVADAETNRRLQEENSLQKRDVTCTDKCPPSYMLNNEATQCCSCCDWYDFYCSKKYYLDCKYIGQNEWGPWTSGSCYAAYTPTNGVRDVYRSCSTTSAHFKDCDKGSSSYKTQSCSYSLPTETSYVTTTRFSTVTSTSTTTSTSYATSYSTSYSTKTLTTTITQPTTVTQPTTTTVTQSITSTITINQCSANFNKNFTESGPAVNAILTDNGYLYSAHTGVIKRWDLKTGEVVNTYSTPNIIVNVLQIEKSSLFAACSDNTIKSWNISTSSTIGLFTGHTDSVVSLVVKDGVMYSGSKDKKIKEWDIATGKNTRTFAKHTGAVYSLLVSNGYLYSGSSDKTLRQWSIALGTNTKSFVNHQNVINTLLINNGLLYSGSYDKTIREWDLETTKNTRTFVGHTSFILTLAVNKNSLYSGSEDQTVKEWNLNTGVNVKDFNLASAVNAISIYNNVLYSGYSNGAIKQWQL
ncbi:hypothetical protein HDU92_004141 [Lobulomyces angularis]|nr:hypothetical protein HDU92_004141 [Lobulomyces angularis]